MSLKIINSAIATGKKKLSNKYFINLYKEKYNEDVSHLLIDILGKDNRYICEDHESSITLGAEAVDKLLRESNIKGSDIDAIVFTSQLPEYTFPTQSCLIHKHIKGKSTCYTLDINANCLGMLRGLDVINRYANDKSGNMRYVLLIGSDRLFKFTREEDIVLHANVGDGACAFLLEYTEDANKGIIGSSDRIISDLAGSITFPACGMSNIMKTHGDGNMIHWSNIVPEAASIGMRDAFEDICKKHNIQSGEVDWYCGTQFSKVTFDEVADLCHIPESKRIFVGDKYGYTGTSSPFFALHTGIKSGKVKEGDLVLLSTVGVGDIVGSLLLRV